MAAIAALACAIAAGPARASETITSFETFSSSSKAGDHPDFETSFALQSPGEPEAARNVIFNSPSGIFGNTNAIPKCSSVAFALDECAPDSQVGLITIRAKYKGNGNYLLGTAPLFDVVPEAEETARFAFIVPVVDISISVPVTVRTGGDYGLRFTVSDITQVTPIAGARLTLWGFPASASHDAERFTKGTPGKPAGCPELAKPTCIGAPTELSIPINPLTDNPTTCPGEPLITRLEVQTYQDPDHLSKAQASYPAVTECERETFNPVLEASATTGETDAPSGLNLELKSPQFEGLSASPSELRSAIVTLPPGFTINPDAADGQRDCTDAEANFGSEGPAACPDNSKIGYFAIGSPTLDGPLTGSLYIGEPRPGNQYRLFMVASGFGMNVKLVGSFKPDPQTGQVNAYFEELPQLPFESFQLHLFASDRGLMATPTSCIVHTVSADMLPWNGTLADQTSTQFFVLTSGPHGATCPGQVRPFNPSLDAGTSNPVAGAHSSFTLKLDREDGDQFLGKLKFTMPPGLTADLRGIAYCPEASITAAIQIPGRTEQVAPSCPASAQIGTSNVAAGPGSHPFHAIGKMYLAGPFQGAPLSLVAITPALAGPYDYGNVVVRVAIHVDPLDAHVVADSETVPQIIGGIPIRMRSIQVNIDKPSFMINPTNCSPFSVDSQGIGDQGTVTDFSSYFDAVNCHALGFKPKMTMRQTGGRKSTRRATNPALQLDLRTRPGDANIKSLSVTLSSAFEIDQRHLGNICSEKELAANQCAGRTPIGKATTTTPLLDQPLSGPAYAVSGSGGLPRLAFVLNGQVNLVPRADTETVKGGRLQTTVPVVPDAPIGHFRLTVFGGKTGYLINTRDICVHTPVTQVAYLAQNGMIRKEAIKVRASCGKKRSRTKRHPRRNVLKHATATYAISQAASAPSGLSTDSPSAFPRSASSLHLTEGPPAPRASADPRQSSPARELTPHRVVPLAAAGVPARTFFPGPTPKTKENR
jgi:hypothetical protein